MSSAAFARVARARLFQTQAQALRAAHPIRAARLAQPAVASFSSSCMRRNDAHHEESFEEFSARYGTPYQGGVGVQWLGSVLGERLRKSAETCLQLLQTIVVWMLC